MKWAKPKPSESKYKRRKITDICKENEEQKEKMRNPQYAGGIITWSRTAREGLALVIGQEAVLSLW